MDGDVIVLLSLVFLAAVPLNVWVAREVRRLARMDPPIDILSLLSVLVNILALIASVLGLIAFASVVTLTTAVRLIPVPGSTVAIIGVLLVASLANVFTWLWLRRSRSHGVSSVTVVGSVVDAGDGHVDVLVDRDTDGYPVPGARVALTWVPDSEAST